MPRFFVAFQKYGNLSPWINCIDPEPPAGEGLPAGSGGPSVESLQQQIAQLQQEIASKDGIIGKLRPIERKWNTVAGGLSDDRLEELRTADQRLAELQQQQEQVELEIRQRVASEYDPKIQGLTKEKEALSSQLEDSNQTYEIFRAFNANGGIGKRFESFRKLTGGNFERNNENGLQVRDDAGQLVIYKDPDAPAGANERVATPNDFVNMLASGAISKSSYQFNQLDMLLYTLEAFNKAGGPLLPDRNGYNGSKPLAEMSKSELEKAAFS